MLPRQPAGQIGNRSGPTAGGLTRRQPASLNAKAAQWRPSTKSRWRRGWAATSAGGILPAICCNGSIPDQNVRCKATQDGSRRLRLSAWLAARSPLSNSSTGAGQPGDRARAVMALFSSSRIRRFLGQAAKTSATPSYIPQNRSQVVRTASNASCCILGVVQMSATRLMPSLT